MTDDMMNLRALVEKAPDADPLREMIGLTAEKLMDLEVGAATGTACGDKNPLRLARRNGCRDRAAEHRGSGQAMRYSRRRLVKAAGNGGHPAPEMPCALYFQSLFTRSTLGSD